MDGVLADLDRGLELMTGLSCEELQADKSILYNTHLPEYVYNEKFAYEYPMKDAHLLIEYVCQTNIPVSILTSAGQFYKEIHEVVRQKKYWIEQNFPILSYKPFTATTSGLDKALFATPNTLLIDDFEKNCIAFRKAGGNALHYYKGIKFQDFVEQFDEMIGAI